MDKKKFIRRCLYCHGLYLPIGVALLVLSRASNSYNSSFGIVFIVVGIAYIAKDILLIKNDDAMDKYATAATDERLIMIAEKAKSAAFNLFGVFGSAAIIALSFAGKHIYAQIIALTLCASLIIYLITYAVIKRRY